MRRSGGLPLHWMCFHQNAGYVCKQECRSHSKSIGVVSVAEGRRRGAGGPPVEHTGEGPVCTASGL